MFFVTFLSDKNRALLEDVDNRLANCIDLSARGALFAEKAEIEKQRKKLNECTLDECNELNSQLYKKLEMLLSMGKRTHAIQFQSMIDLVGNRRITIMTEIAKEEAIKEEEKQRANKKSIAGEDDERSKPNTKTRSLSSKWTVGIDELD